MKVILQKDVKGHGKKGQLVEVSDGYGRNYLLPRKLAVEASAENMNTMKMQEKARLAKEAAREGGSGGHCPEAERVHGEDPRQGGQRRQAVRLRHLQGDLRGAEAAVRHRHSQEQERAISEFGTFELKCKLGYEVTGTLYVTVMEEK